MNYRFSALSSGEPSSLKPDLYVVARIIKTLMEENPINKTALATHTGLSYDKLLKYLAWMSEKGFVKADQDGNVLLTDEGRAVYDDLVAWILKYVGKLKFPRVKVRT